MQRGGFHNMLPTVVRSSREKKNAYSVRHMLPRSQRLAKFPCRTAEVAMPGHTAKIENSGAKNTLSSRRNNTRFLSTPHGRRCNRRAFLLHHNHHQQRRNQTYLLQRQYSGDDKLYFLKNTNNFIFVSALHRHHHHRAPFPPLNNQHQR